MSSSTPPVDVDRAGARHVGGRPRDRPVERPVDLHRRRVVLEAADPVEDAPGHVLGLEQLEVELRRAVSASTALRASDLAPVRGAHADGAAAADDDPLHARAALDAAALALKRATSAAVSRPAPPSGTGHPSRWPRPTSVIPNSAPPGVSGVMSGMQRVAGEHARGRVAAESLDDEAAHGEQAEAREVEQAARAAEGQREPGAVADGRERVHERAR